MPKEYDSIKKSVAKDNPKLSDKEVSAKAAKIFHDIYGITVKEAIALEKDGKWQAYLKEHSSKEKTETKDYGTKDMKTTFNVSSFELKEKEDAYYISGFVSAPSVDSHGDLLGQQKIVDKLLDPNNSLSKYLSYSHGWLKGDRSDTTPLGVLQSAELKEHPKIHQPAAWAEYKLIKTHPKYEDAIYNIKEHVFTGFSIEFKEARRKLMRFGNTVVKKVTDYVLGGVGLLARPSQSFASLTGFVAKEYYYNGGTNMEIKENELVEKNDVEEPTKKVDEPTPEAEKKPESEDKPKKDSNKESSNDGEISNLKKQLDSLREEKAEEVRKKEIENIKKEIDNLKANKTVLVEKDKEQNFKNQDPDKTKAEEMQEELKTVVDNKELDTEAKLKKIADIEFNQNK